MSDKKIEVGQKVWVRPSRITSRTGEPYESTVSKVGRKYFELQDNFDKYDLATLRGVTNSNYASQVYLSHQEILDEKEYSQLSDALRKCFHVYSKLPYSLEQLRKIHEIINKTK